MKDLISIIIPTYNAENTIKRCIESIYSNNVEIIVIIDGATDNTLKICKKLQKDNKSIKIIEQNNKGPFEARNRGIQEAKGEYIMFLDSDDKFVSRTVERMNEVINKFKKPDLIKFRYRKMPKDYLQYKYTELEEIEIKKKDFKEKVYQMFLKGYMLNALWNNCVRKEILKEINIESSNIRFGEDLLLNLEIFSNIKNVVFINDVLYEYIENDKSITNSKSLDRLFNNLKDSISTYTTLYKYLLKWDMYNIENITIINKRIEKETNEITNRIKKCLDNTKNKE